MLNPAPVKRPIVQNRISRAGYWFVPASESQVNRQERLLKAVNSVASCLFSREIVDFNRTVEDSLCILGRSVNAEHVVIWKNYMADDCLRVSRLAGWNSPDLAEKLSKLMNQQVSWDFPIEEILPNWEKMLEEQKPEYFICKNLHEPFRSIALNKGIHSILLIPIFSQGNYWGFISFFNYSEQRLYTGAEKELLRSGGILIASAIENNKNLMELQQDIKAPVWQGKTILAVDDNKINREIVGILLEKTGIVIETADNGAEAVTKFRENPGKYNLILMDIEMPEMDGLDATREIRKLEAELNSQKKNATALIQKVFEYTGSDALNNIKKIPGLMDFFKIKENGDSNANEIPIIAMTTNIFTSDIQNCLKAGMNAHVAKPIYAEKLFKTMQGFLN